MGEFLNHNSFLLSVVFLWLAAAWGLLRKERSWQRWLALGAVSAVLLIGYDAVRPAQATGGDAETLRAQIGAGQPVLLEFQSQN
ncbi:MAG: hypothetical protein P8046_00050 [Anaerolineales bacterium]|jgi:hypothetical protein